MKQLSDAEILAIRKRHPAAIVLDGEALNFASDIIAAFAAAPVAQPSAEPLPKEVRDALEFYAHSLDWYVTFDPKQRKVDLDFLCNSTDWQEDGEDSRGHEIFRATTVRAESALEKLTEWESAAPAGAGGPTAVSRDDFDKLSADLTRAKNLLVRLHSKHPEARAQIEGNTGNWFVWGTDRDGAGEPTEPSALARELLEWSQFLTATVQSVAPPRPMATVLRDAARALGAGACEQPSEAPR